MQVPKHNVSLIDTFTYDSLVSVACCVCVPFDFFFPLLLFPTNLLCKVNMLLQHPDWLDRATWLPAAKHYQGQKWPRWRKSGGSRHFPHPPPVQTSDTSFVPGVSVFLCESNWEVKCHFCCRLFSNFCFLREASYLSFVYLCCGKWSCATSLFTMLALVHPEYCLIDLVIMIPLNFYFSLNLCQWLLRTWGKWGLFMLRTRTPGPGQNTKMRRWTISWYQIAVNHCTGQAVGSPRCMSGTF